MEIRAKNLQVAYGDTVVVDQLNIQLEKGKITTIIGPNGSGKSTVLKAVTRLLNYQKGAVYLNGRELQKFGTKELAQQIGVLPQMHTAPPDFKVKDLVSYGRMPYQKWYKRNQEQGEKIIEWAMHSTGVYKLKEKSIQECSGGEAQRVWIATVMAQQPEMMFLDEPTTYLDISHQLETMRLIKKVNQESGIGIVMVLHDLGQALEISDHIIVIQNGKKYDEGRPEDVITAKMMKEVYNVDCDVVWLKKRKKPLIVYKEIC